MWKFLWHVEQDIIHHLRVIKLPWRHRLLHPKTVRHATGVSVGVGLMLAGSWSAKHGVEFVPLNHLVVDTFGYLVHGIGLMPIASHLEPLWAILKGAE